MTSKDHIPGIFSILRPDIAVERPLILDSPHSGHIYPDDFSHVCSRDVLNRAEDNEVDTLFGHTPEIGGTLLSALFPRTYIDVNRAEDDIDTELLSERWPGPLNPTSRSYAGIGLIRRLVKPGTPVYDHSLSVAEIKARIDGYYRPYHTALKELLDDAHYRFGQVWHINCHSMPGSSAALTNGVLNMQPDFVLGDRDGTSCDLDFTHTLCDALRDMGYRVAINNPYKGVEIVRRSANPAEGRNSIQIEVSKSLYWDEKKNEKNENFNKLKSDIDKLIELCARYVDSHLSSMAAD